MYDFLNERLLRERLAGKRVMITGGLGMLGSTIAHYLLHYGAKVTLVDACIEPYGANRFNIEDIHDRVEVSITDIRDKAAMKFLCKDKDIIFNLAAQVSHNDSIDDPFLDADINYFGHLNIIENIRKLNLKTKILFSGSRLQFGKIDKNPVDELHTLRPRTPYAFNKTVAENMYNYYYALYGIPCVILRIANPYGIRCQMKHSKYSIVNYFIRQAMEDREITIFGSGEQIRDYIYVEDVAYAFILATAEEKANGETFNLGSGIGTKFKDMVRMVVETVGSGTIRHIPWPKDYINVETGDYVTDITKISNVLGWKPKTTLKEGIEKTYAYYKKYKQYYF